RSRPMLKTEVARPPLNMRAAVAGAICFALVLAEIARLTSAWPAAIASLLAGAVFLRRRLFAIDLSIVPLFFFAFIIVEGLRSLRLDVAGGSLYVTAIAASQILSNVPATVLLSPLANGHWRELL